MQIAVSRRLKRKQPMLVGGTPSKEPRQRIEGDPGGYEKGEHSFPLGVLGHLLIGIAICRSKSFVDGPPAYAIEAFPFDTFTSVGKGRC